MKEYTQEDLDGMPTSHALDVDSTIIVQFEKIGDSKTGKVERFWKLSDIIEKLNKLK